MSKFYFLLSTLFFINNLHAQTWNLVWADSFSNNNINAANWRFESGNNNGWGNSELEYYTDRPENAIVQNGNLNIIAKQESYQSFDYTSARMISKDLQSWTYGKIEARIKMHQTQGLWPAFWMLGNNISAVSWPECGEIDIMEHVNFDPKIYGTLHWNDNGHVVYGSNKNCDVTQYHLYSIEWNADSIKWMLDNIVYHSAIIKNNINNTNAFHKPFFIILNMAVGGAWPGSPTASSIFPDTMKVDYINVFQKGSATNLQTETPSNFTLYPNPVAIKLHIDYDFLEDGLLQIYDATGRQIINEILSHTLKLHSSDLSIFQTGLYYYKITEQNGLQKTGTFCKQ
jgi:beta-glucanase (GH16 family)